jgi:hypothetical protein
MSQDFDIFFAILSTSSILSENSYDTWVSVHFSASFSRVAQMRIACFSPDRESSSPWKVSHLSDHPAMRIICS